MVCSSSIKRITCPCSASSSFKTAFRRSSNSPRYLAPATSAATKLSQRYITDRQLPDKAIDLIDEAASQIRMEIDSKPESMDKLDRKLVQLKIERMALKKEKDKASKERFKELEIHSKTLEKEYAYLDEV